MAETGKKVRTEMGSMSALLNFQDHPKRRLFIVGVIALLGLAVLSVLFITVHSAGGCNAILSTQRFSCIQTLAAQSGSASLCNKITNGGMRTSCIMSVALSKKNSSICYSQFSGRETVNCVENISYAASDPSLCDGLDSYNQSDCRYLIEAAVNFSMPSYCTGIKERSYGVLCNAQSYYHLAVVTGNYSYCGDLPPTTNGSILYSMAQQNPAYESTPTGAFSGLLNTSLRDFCYSSLASSGSHASCAYISNSTLQAGCYAMAQNSTASFTVANVSASCANQTVSSLRNLCYFGLYTNEAAATSNVAWCSQIPNATYSTSCVVNLASSSDNQTYCNALGNANDIASCQEQTQLQNGNANYT
jgi:hypothetical protein